MFPGENPDCCNFRQVHQSFRHTPDWHRDIAFLIQYSYLPRIYRGRQICFEKIKIRKMTLNRALDKYLKTVSVHKKGHLQEFYRVNVIKRHPMAERYMDEITTVDIATYRDQRLAQINPRTGRQITGNTVRLELALLSSLFNIASVEWGDMPYESC